jgi:hypothetical protein
MVLFMANILAIILIIFIVWWLLEIAIILVVGLFIVTAFSSHTEAGNMIGFLGLIAAVYMLTND